MLHSWSRTQRLKALVALMYGVQAALAIDLDLKSTDSIKQAAATVAHGMMTYYKGNESGMPQGLLPDPYYWWEAGAMFGQMVEYWFYTGDETYNKVVTQGLLAQVGPEKDFMPPNQTKTEGNDDQAFWAFAALSAAEMKYPDPPPKQPSWLSLAQAVFNLQASRWDTTSCGGGLRWQIFPFNKGYDYKNSISNGGFFQLSARLARYTKNDTYAQWAEKSWDWMKTTPLFTDSYHIYDGANIQNNCTIASKIQWSYNIGTFLMGAANMYNYTNGDAKWKQRVEGLLQGANLFFPSEDIMVEVACEPQVTCNYDQPSFKAYLARWMAATAQIAPFTSERIMIKLRASAIGAAKQCSGGPDGQTCGRHWTTATWDGKTGVGEQMSALSVIQANLIQKVAPPVTQDTGGVSKSDPSAGTKGDKPANVDNLVTRQITAGDRAGASILTAITVPFSALVFRIHTIPRQPWSLVPPRNEAKSFITSLQKKRKLSRQDKLEAQLPARAAKLDGSSSPSRQSLSPTRRPPLAESASKLISSPSSPYCLSQHIGQAGAGTGRSPTPERTNSAASSPSGAYADLTLDNNRGEHALDPDDQRVKVIVDTSYSRGVHIQGSLSSRSTSLAKGVTSATDMEETTETTKPTGVLSVGENERPTSSSELASHIKNAGSLPANLQKENLAQYGKEAIIRSPPAEHDQRPSEGKPSSILQAQVAYQTPESGVSTDSSMSTRDMYLNSSLVPTVEPDALPSIDEQIKQVTQLAQNPMQEGQRGFVVSKKWLSRVLARGSNSISGEKFDKGASEGVIGPVNNTDINLVADPPFESLTDEAGEPFVPLKPGLQLSEDFEILPLAAWNLIVKWYGLSLGSDIITRYCHNTSTSEVTENLQYELHPPIFTVLKLPDRSGGMTTKLVQEAAASPVKILASRHELYQTFLKRVKNLANIDLKTKVRVWRILGGLGAGAKSGMITPAHSRSNSPAPNYVAPVDPGNRLVLDVNTFAELQLGSQRELIETKDETANEKYNGHSNLDIVGLRQDGVIVLEEQIGGPAGGEWVSDNANRQVRSNGLAISVTKSGSTVVQDSLKPKAAGSGRSSPAPSGMMTRGRAQKQGRPIGTTGLNNLGNTCYMNSALQCIRSVEELTQYFLLDKYKVDLNPDNPLSHNGQVAKAYATLLKEMFNPNTTQSFAPRNFKNVIGKYGPSFSGYQQQDSQEFLLFLLDGLQEDLSRIRKKPYIEKPDSTDEMVNDPVALRELADKCWDIYQARNDSVITDLFAGMYKSTVVCPVCNKVSIIFDPYNNLTLQLPIENAWSREIYYFPLNQKPLRVGVDIDKNASFMALKEYLAGKVGIDPKKAVLAEIYKNRFYKMFDDKKSIAEERIADTDNVAFYELESQPSNYPPPKRKTQKFKSMLYVNNSDEDEDIPEGDSPLADKMLISVFHRRAKGFSRMTHRELFGVPSYIVVTRDEAKDYDAILRKVLANVATMTTKDIFKDSDEWGTDSTPEDSDAVLMNTDDGDSSSDSKFQAKSLESEDGILDITMRDGVDESAVADRARSPALNVKHRSLPKMLRPGEFIDPALRNIFDMKYFSVNNEMIPTGWSSLHNESAEYPTLSSRLPEDVERQSLREKLARRSDRLESASLSEADDENAESEAPNKPLQTDYESDSDGLPDISRVAQVPVASGRLNGDARRDNKTLITYSRKGKFPAHSRDRGHVDPQHRSIPLIRLGEAIMVDWTPEAYDSLFFGEKRLDGSMRGSPTWDNIDLIPDPELQKKRELRITRKRNGISLDDCLDEFGKAEILSENDAWYCPRCKEHRRASKTFELWKAPDILVIHLKRFSTHGRNLRDKLDILVDFPIEGLGLSSRVAMKEEGKDLVYDLFAVDNHYGGLGGGHYTAFAQNTFDKNWYEYNDSSVTRRSDPKAVVTSAAYLLFYRRRASHPLGGLFFEQLIEASRNPTSESQPPSRPESPTGEGRRLDDTSSRNGLSSALVEAGATHQAGGGGLAGGIAVQRRTGVDDDLPSYSTRVVDQQVPSTLEGMDLDDDDEAVADMNIAPLHSARFTPGANWTFANIESSMDDEMQGMTQRSTATPASASEDEGLFSGESNKAEAEGSSDEDRRFADFADDDQGTTSGAFRRAESPSSQDDLPYSLENYEKDSLVGAANADDKGSTGGAFGQTRSMSLGDKSDVPALLERHQ